VHNTQLDLRVGENRGNSVRKAFQTIDAGNQYIFDITVLKLCQTFSQNLAASFSDNHKPSNSL